MYEYHFLSPIGWLKLMTVEEKVKRLFFVLEQPKESQKENPFIKEVSKNIMAYFKNYKTGFSFAMEPEGTAFQKQIWELLGRIPPGQTVSYSEIAATYGDRKALRAVGNAIGKNPILIAIPCHRVIGNKGQLTGYAGGLDKKRALLKHECAIAQTSLHF